MLNDNVSENKQAVVSSDEEHVAGGFGLLPVSHEILKCSFDRRTLLQVALVRRHPRREREDRHPDQQGALREVVRPWVVMSGFQCRSMGSSYASGSNGEKKDRPMQPRPKSVGLLR